MITPDSWIPAADLTLEPNGLNTARFPTSVALTAGPGAGKTEVLAQRCDFLLRTGACGYPRRILAIAVKRDARTNLADRVRDRCGQQLSDRLDSYTFHAFSKSLIDRFRPVLTGADELVRGFSVGSSRIHREQIRFRDMVPLATKILCVSPIALSAVRQTYSHLLLDEFQDCTDDQYELIRVAFLGTSTIVTAVGDTKQGIMRYAGALDDVFDRFIADFSAKNLNLYLNRRSKVRLRRMQNEMVKVMDPDASVAADELVGDEGEAVHLQFDSELDEAAHLAEMLRGWIADDGIPPSRIAVLVSKQPELYARELMLRLNQLGVPYRDEKALQDLVKEPIFSLLNDFLRVVFGKREPAAYSRLLSYLVPKESDARSEFRTRSFWDEYFVNASSASASSLADKVGTACELFVDEVGKSFLRSLSQEYAEGPYINDVIAQTRANIQQTAIRSNNMQELLLALDNDESIKLMTIHKSKGLEFHSVVVLGVENESFWGDPADERAAYFVAISRAEERLVLTSASERSRPADAWKWHVQRTPQGEFLNYLYLSA